MGEHVRKKGGILGARSHRYIVVCHLFFFISGCPSVAAEKESSAEASTVKGYAFGMVYTGEVLSNMRGGIQTHARYMDNLDVTLEIDTEKAFGLTGGTFFAYGLYNNDATLSEDVVGDSQVLSNIDTPEAFRMFELWYDQTLLDDRLSLRLGLYDLNSEFDVNETGGLFISSFHGIGVDFSQTGRNGPSIFPVTSLAFRARWQIKDNWSVQGVVLDAVPGDPNHPARTAVKLGNGEGVLGVVELDYAADDGTRLVAGYWRYTADFEDIVRTDAMGTPLQRSGNDGFYLLVERNVFQEKNSSEQGLSVFARYGRAQDDVNPFKSYLGFGAVYTGLVSGRGEDQLGLAVAIAKNGKPFRRAQALAGMPVEKRETAIELSYRAPLSPWLIVQPNAHYIVNPGTDPTLKNAFVLGLRFEIGVGWQF